MKDLFKFFTKEVVKPFPVPEYIIFNVNNFNVWFNHPENNAVYANPGIFLRMDKLSIAHIVDYIDKCYGIPSRESSLNKDLYKFMDEIKLNWKRKILWRQKIADKLAAPKVLICNNCKDFWMAPMEKCVCGSTSLTETHKSNAKYAKNADLSMEKNS